jgi:hypothetical protein
MAFPKAHDGGFRATFIDLDQACKKNSGRAAGEGRKGKKFGQDLQDEQDKLSAEIPIQENPGMFCQRTASLTNYYSHIIVEYSRFFGRCEAKSVVMWATPTALLDEGGEIIRRARDSKG